MLTEFILPLLLVTVAQPVEATDLGERELDWLKGCVRDPENAVSEREGWAIIKAEGMIHPGTLAAAIRLAPEGKRIVVMGGDFSGGDMRPVAPLLAGACISGTDLTGSEWSDTDIADLQLERAVMREVTARNIRWPRLSARGVHVEESDFSGADLTGLRWISQFQGANFYKVSFRDAVLVDASFACGITSDVWCINATPDLGGADLTGADMSGLGLWDEEMNAGAILNGTIVAPRSIANLDGAIIAGPIRLATYYADPYGGSERPPIVGISADDARALIAATRSETVPDAPSFDCEKAATPVETMICGEYDSHLRMLDRELADAWSKLRSAGKGSLGEQRRWLRARSACEDRTCLQEKYETRIAALRGALGPGIALAPDQSITYYSDVLPLPEVMRSGGLYERLVPVLVDASYQRITLTGREDGSIAAEGDAVGGNAHLCGMYVPEARFDPASGWWSAVSEIDNSLVPIFRIDGRRIMMRYSGNLGDTPEAASHMMSCGARAGFTDGIDLKPG